MKIDALGITGEVLKWIENWFKNREQRVVLLGSNSKCTRVKSSVLHGSVLGPLLFLIYINDIDDSVCSNLVEFADDTKVFSVVQTKNDIDRLHKDLLNLGKWSQDWLMLFNVDKCKVMHLAVTI
jgi:ribonuclease P/MRP protein subunit RPP40